MTQIKTAVLLWGRNTNGDRSRAAELFTRALQAARQFQLAEVAVIEALGVGFAWDADGDGRPDAGAPAGGAGRAGRPWRRAAGNRWVGFRGTGRASVDCGRPVSRPTP